MAETLEEAGYDVVTASDGVEALALIEDPARRFSALFSDYHLPGGVTGLDLARAMRALHPGRPVFLATGRPDVLEMSRRSADGFVLLQKPYGPAQMVSAIGRLLPPHRPIVAR